MFSRLILLCSFLAVAPLAAQQNGALTLDDAVRIAVQQNASVRVARARVAVAAEDVGIARASFFPEIGVAGQYRRFETHLFLPPGIPLTTSVVGPIDDWSAGLTLRYSIYDGGARRGNTSAAEALRNAAQSGETATEQQIAFVAQRAFFELVAAESAVDASEARLKRSEEHLRAAKERKDAGTVPQLDVLRASAAVANARLGVISAKSAVEVARGRLNETLGRSADESTSVVAPAAAAAKADGAATLLIERALSRRPEVVAARQRVKAQGALERVARSIMRPKADVRGSYGVRDDAFVPQDPDWAVGIGVTMPLFDGGATSHRVAKARAEEERAAAELQDVESAVREDVWEAIVRVNETYESIDAAEQAKVESEESLRHAQRRYAVGAATISDVLDAESVLADAESRVIATSYAHATARANLKRATGE